MKTPCRICGASDYRYYARVNGFCLERCRRCSLLQVTDDLSAVSLGDYYDQAFFEHTYDWQRESKGRIVVREKCLHRLGEIEKVRPDKGNLLEVGCGLGFFLEAARFRGWRSVGVEVGPYAVRYAREELGLDVHQGELVDAPLPCEEFDVVAMWDVVEHVDQPTALLQHVAKLLKKGGLLVINTPDVDSYMRRLQGMRWRCFIPPIHLTYFGRRSMDALLQRTGFQVVLRTVSLPREKLLQRLHIFGILKQLRCSDKMLVFARRS